MKSVLRTRRTAHLDTEPTYRVTIHNMDTFSALSELPTSPGVIRHQDPGASIPEWWKKLGDDRWGRIRPDARLPIVRDAPLAWTDALEQTCVEVRQTLWQRLRGEVPSSVVYGPQGKLFEKVREEAKDAVLIWLEETALSFETALGAKHIRNESVEQLGPSFALLRGPIPLRHEPNPDYVPPSNEFMRIEETMQVYGTGVSHIFRCMRGRQLPEENNPPGQDIPVLERFWRDVRWADLRSDDKLHFMGGLSPGDVYIMYVRPEHALYTTNTAMTLCTSYEKPPYGVFIKPYKITPIWAGLSALHELRHLYSISDPPRRFPNTPEGKLENEYAAWSCQLHAMHVLSRGRLCAGLDAAIEHLHITSVHLLNVLYDADSKRPLKAWRALVEDLDRLIDPEAPRSLEEYVQRSSSYCGALGWHLVDKACHSSIERENARRDFLANRYAEYWGSAFGGGGRFENGKQRNVS